MTPPSSRKAQKEILDKPKWVRYTMYMTKELREYFKKIGRKGGKSKSERKINASRKNGKLGGRPKLQTSALSQ